MALLKIDTINQYYYRLYLKYGHPGEADIIKWYGSLKRIGAIRKAFRIVRIPIDTAKVGHERGRFGHFNCAIANHWVVDVGRYVAAGGHATGVRAYVTICVLGLVVRVPKRLVHQTVHERRVVVEEAAIAQHALPQLHPDNTEYEENKKTQQQNIAQHWQCVQQ
jgi:hypothetical protein